MERVFNKLVRDNIPNIIALNGEESITRVLDDEEYKVELYKKLLEETNEVISSKDSNETIEELADVLEILSAIAKLNGKMLDDVVEAAKQKKLKRGGFEVQINVVDNETLKKAQQNPEEYQDLVVRIGGYSDYFVRLSPEMQEEVILRTSHNV